MSAEHLDRADFDESPQPITDLSDREPSACDDLVDRQRFLAYCGEDAPGTVDAGFRGELAVTLVNTDATEPVTLRRGDRIAQLVVQQVARARFVEAERLPGSQRGADGWGSTGGVSAWSGPTGPGASPAS